MYTEALGAVIRPRASNTIYILFTLQFTFPVQIVLPNSKPSLQLLTFPLCMLNRHLNSSSNELVIFPSQTSSYPPPLVEPHPSVAQAQHLAWSLTLFLHNSHQTHQEILLAPSSKQMENVTVCLCLHHRLSPGSLQDPPSWSPSFYLWPLLSVLKTAARGSLWRHKSGHVTPLPQPHKPSCIIGSKTYGPSNGLRGHPLLYISDHLSTSLPADSAPATLLLWVFLEQPQIYSCLLILALAVPSF